VDWTGLICDCVTDQGLAYTFTYLSKQEFRSRGLKAHRSLVVTVCGINLKACGHAEFLRIMRMRALAGVFTKVVVEVFRNFR